MNYTYDAENFKNIFEQNFTWIGGFMRNVRRYSDRKAVIDPIYDVCWTYGELNSHVNRMANALAACGCGVGDKVFYQLYNSPEFILCYVAPQKLGTVNCPGNCNLSAGETARIIDRDKPKAYIYDCDIMEMAEQALKLCHEKPALVLAVDHLNKKPQLPEGHHFFGEYIEQFQTAEPECSFTPDMYMEVTRLGTSGTTGTPKAVPLNNANEVLSAHDVMMNFPLNLTDVTLNMTPWFHRGGLHSGGPTPTLYAGACLVALRLFNAKACFECIEKYGVTFMIGVPSALGTLCQRQERHPVDLSGIKGIVTMGSPLERDECIRFQKVLTPNIFNGYGTTETFWNSFLRPSDLPENAGSAGGSCTDDEVRIVNIYDDRKAEPDDTVPKDGNTAGEIIINACCKSALCYADNPEQTAEKYYKGWFYTKDIGTWDGKSFVTVSGRKDDMIICMGENIYPAQLEEILNRHPKVADCMVTGVADEVRGQSVAAYIIPADPDLDAAEMNRYCIESDDISAYKCPRYYRFVDELPYNATGKKLHYVLKEQAEKDKQAGLLKRPGLKH